MNIRVLKTAKLPLEKCTGSIKTRQQKAAELADEFFNQIKNEFGNKDIPLSTIEKKIRKQLPNKRIFINKLSDSDSFQGFLRFKESKGGNLGGYTMELPINKYSKKVDLKHTDNIMHEYTHLLSFMFNPKYTVRLIKLKTQDFYNKNIYITGIKNFKKNMDKFFKEKNPQEKIDFLQNWRYSLKDEILAYSNGKKYEKQMKKAHPHKFISPNDYIDKSKYKFEEKIQIIEEKLLETIQNERKLHAESLK